MDDDGLPQRYRGSQHRTEPNRLSKLEEKERLNDRFSSKAEKPFVPKENITVGIERNIEGNEPAVPRAFDAEQVVIYRPKDEGV